MWRAFFLAVGVYVALFGAQCLIVQKFVLKARQTVVAKQDPYRPNSAPKLGPKKEFVPLPWVPYSLMSTGVVVCLYSFTIPNRMHGK
jgi:hypothetical protein